MTFTADVRTGPDRAVLSVGGDLNALAHQPFDAAAERALAGAPAELVLDFSATTFINSTGIALIVSLLGRARAQRTLVVARGLDDHHRHIFDITRLSDFMQIEEAGDQAVRSAADRQQGGHDHA